MTDNIFYLKEEYSHNNHCQGLKTVCHWVGKTYECLKVAKDMIVTSHFKSIFGDSIWGCQLDTFGTSRIKQI